MLLNKMCLTATVRGTKNSQGVSLLACQGQGTGGGGGGLLSEAGWVLVNIPCRAV